MKTPSMAFASLLLLHLWIINLDHSVSGLRGESILSTDYYGDRTFHLQFRTFKYTWEEAQQACRERHAFVARQPIPESVLDRFADAIDERTCWVSNEVGHCKTVMKGCRTNQPSVLGGTRCYERQWVFKDMDCSGSLYNVICERGQPPTIPTTTTPSTTSTSTTVTTPTTTTATTTTTTPTPRRVQTLQTGKPVTYLIPTVPRKPNKDSDTVNDLTKNAGTFLIALGAGDKAFLGLIIAVVTGTFLISALFICICCACHKKSRTYGRKRYDVIHGSSMNTLGGGQRTDTTTDTSLEDGSSDDRSHKARHDAYYDGIDAPPMFATPLMFQDQPTSASVCDFRHAADDSMYPRSYHTMGGRLSMDNAVDNSLYSSIIRNHQRQNDVQDLPLPPPPPSIAPMPEELLPRDQSQNSMAGFRSDPGTVTSARSRQNRQSRQSRQNRNNKKSKRGRGSLPPNPVTYSPSSSFSTRSHNSRNQQDEQALSYL